MAALTFILYALATFLLLHSAYSAYEFSVLLKHLALSSSASSSQELIPLDIKIEAVLGAILVTAGAVYSKTGLLKNIKFSEAIVEDELAGKGYVYLQSKAELKLTTL